MIIRKLTLEDIDLLQDIGKRTFADTFSSDDNKQDMEQYLKQGFSLEKLRKELININSEFYFVEVENKAIGYLKVNRGDAQTEIQDEKALEIERIYVLKAFYGKRIGQVLYEKALEIAKRNQVDYLWLGVWEENFRAIRFYEKNGFVEFDKHVFKLGHKEEIDIMMKLKINE